ncbi:hypothetical protein [Kribbella sp. NPDC000426]|uniref:hypothetical protein n=1 Tax=Kribbella sp. NPDC000426 TaxID=3154255 RepID=UPI003333AC96
MRAAMDVAGVRRRSERLQELHAGVPGGVMQVGYAEGRVRRRPGTPKAGYAEGRVRRRPGATKAGYAEGRVRRRPGATNAAGGRRRSWW